METIDSLTRQLDRLAPRLAGGPARVTGLRRLSGGASQQTWSFDIEPESASTRIEAIMRRGPAGGRPRRTSANAGLETEAALIRVAARHGVPVPEVLHVLAPDDGLGDGFLMRRLQGETLGRKIATDARFAAARDELAYQCGAALARIHRIPLDELPPLRIAGPAAELDEYITTHRGHGTIKPVFELAFRWLKDQLPRMPGNGVVDRADARLVHGDFRNGNIMVDEQGLVAALDWELAHLGDPMADLGWLCVNSWRFGVVDKPVGGFGEREQLFAGYEAAGGRVDPARVRFWETLGTLKWGIMCERMAQAVLSGAETSVEKATIGRRSSETEIDLLNLLAPRAGSL
ncbi:MAG: phosphotransferase family protein [Burkholderiaceae bacterium]